MSPCLHTAANTGENTNKLDSGEEEKTFEKEVTPFAIHDDKEDTELDYKSHIFNAWDLFNLSICDDIYSRETYEQDPQDREIGGSA